MKIVCGAMHGKFIKNQQAHYCAESTSNGKVWDFTIKRVSGGDEYMWLSLDDCVDGLFKEIRGCERGGKTTYTNWEYKYV